MDKERLDRFTWNKGDIEVESRGDPSKPLVKPEDRAALRQRVAEAQQERDEEDKKK